MKAVRRQVAAGMTERRDDWLAYLHGHATCGLARLDLVLEEVDRVRQAVERPDGSRLFGAGSGITGQAIQAAREAQERAATALAPLERHAARSGKKAATVA